MSGFTPKLHVLDMQSSDEIQIPNFRGSLDFRTARAGAARDDKTISGGAELDALIYIRLSLGTQGDVIPLRAGEQFRMLRDAERDIDGVSVFSPNPDLFGDQPNGTGVYAVIIEADPEAYEIIR